MLRNISGRLEDVSPRSGPAFRVSRAARGLAVGDLNNDGLPDNAINCINSPAIILKNTGGQGNNWLLVNTVGTASNRDGIGARVRLVRRSLTA
jgi:hypothetical protein